MDDAAQLRTAKKNMGIAVKQLELRLDAADRRASMADDKRAAVERDLGTLRQRHATCHDRDRDAQRRLMNLTADFDRQKLELERAKAQVEQLEDQHGDLRQSLLQSSSQHVALITAAEAKATVAVEEKDNLVRQRDFLADELDDARRQLAGLRTEISGARSRETELEEKCARLEGSLGHADTLEQQNEELTAEVANLRQACDDKEAQLDALRCRIRDLEAEVNRTGGELQELLQGNADVAAAAGELEARVRAELEEKYQSSLVTTTATTTTEEQLNFELRALQTQVLTLTKDASREKSARQEAEDAARRKIRIVAQNLADVLRTAASARLILKQEIQSSSELRTKYDTAMARVKDLECRLEDSDSGRARLEKAYVQPLQAQLDKCTDQMNAAIRERAVVAQQLQAASTAIISRDTKVAELQLELKLSAEREAKLVTGQAEAKEALDHNSRAHSEAVSALQEQLEASRQDLIKARQEGAVGANEALVAEQAATEKAIQQLGDAERLLQEKTSENHQCQQEIAMLRRCVWGLLQSQFWP